MDARKKKKKKENYQASLLFYGLLIVAAALTDIVTYRPEQRPVVDFFSYALGIVGVFAFGSFAQRIISQNLFTRCSLLGLLFLVLGFFKQWLTHFDLLSLYIVTIPLAYIGYFRLLTRLFYSKYPVVSSMPRIIYASRYWIGKSAPPFKERLFAMLLSIGFIWVAVLLVSLLHYFLSPILVQHLPVLASSSNKVEYEYPWQI